MKNWEKYSWKQTILVAALAMLALFVQSEAQPPSSAQSLPSLGTGASKAIPLAASEKIVNACAAAAEELAKTRLLIEALERENKHINERLETEKNAAAILLELNRTRSSEAEALRTAVAAKNETIAAKEAVIAGQDKLIQTLKNKKISPWKRIGDVLLGAAILAVLK